MLIIASIFALIIDFISIGWIVGKIKFFTWLLLKILLMFFGVWIIRGAGFSVLLDTVKVVTNKIQPEQYVADKLITVVSGILLLLPGFLSDILGLLLWLTPLGGICTKYIGILLNQSINILKKTTHTTDNQGRTFEAEFERRD